MATEFTPEKRVKFLKKLAEMPNVARACRLAVVSRPTVYKLRNADPDFAAAWDDAIETAVDKLEEKAFQRAVKESDTLIIFLLKAHRPELYRETRAIVGPDGGPVQITTVEIVKQYGEEDGGNE